MISLLKTMAPPRNKTEIEFMKGEYNYRCLHCGSHKAVLATGAFREGCTTLFYSHPPDGWLVTPCGRQICCRCARDIKVGPP